MWSTINTKIWAHDFCEALCNQFVFVVEDRAAQSLINKLIRNALVDNMNQVEVLQKDPSSPLYSAKAFEDLCV